MTNNYEIFQRKHSGDEAQLEVIFSSNQSLLVEAPAGYGKTNTMISKIAFMLLNNELPNPKKVLALTFSVNAAYKIKKDVVENIPILLNDNQSVELLKKKIVVSNYHGFCRNVLRKYGRLLSSQFSSFDNMKTIDDSRIENSSEALRRNYEDANNLSMFSDSVKKCNYMYINENIGSYNKIVIEKLIPNNFITYNSILTLTIDLFEKFPSVLRFYQTLFTVVLIDEYQDTNFLSYLVLRKIITDKTIKLFFGDPLQRIYGFIGAVPDIFEKSLHEFTLRRIQLTKNYRFQNNQKMLLLDRLIRKNAENPYEPDISSEEYSQIEFIYNKTQEDEAITIIEILQEICRNDLVGRISIIVKTRSENINLIMSKLDASGIPYFYGLFADDDQRYLSFNRDCHNLFSELCKQNKKISNSLLNKFYDDVNRIYEDNDDPVVAGLIELLSVFLLMIKTEYRSLSNEDRISFVDDTFMNNGIKQYIGLLNKRITITTVHGSKGLEWDYVILPDMEQDSFPNYYGLCSSCQTRNICSYTVTSKNITNYLEELSVFYVAVTRARKRVVFTASEFQINRNKDCYKKNISCFLRLKGMVL